MPIQLSGSLVITGSITTTGVITMSGSIASASYSSNSDLLQGTGSVGFTTTASFNAVSSSQQQISSSLLNVIAILATTGSNSFRADQSITGSLVVSSTITAQTLVVQTVTSSIVYSSGSNIFGSALADRQTFTGSVNITGSCHAIFGNVGIATNIPRGVFDVRVASDRGVTVTGTVSSETVISGMQGDVSANLRNLRIAGNNLSFNTGDGTNSTGIERVTVTSAGNVGIGAGSPDATLHICCSAGSANALLAHFQNSGGGTAIATIKIGEGSPEGQYGVLGHYGADNSFRIGSVNGNLSFHAGASTACGTNLYGMCERLTILTSGCVGIGTSSPGYRLEICGDGTGIGELAVKGTGTDIGLALNNTGTGGKAWRILSTGGGSGAGNGKLITWDGTGYGWVMDCGRNMGIGTTTVDSYPNYTTLQVGCTNGIIQTYDGTVKTAIVSNSQCAGLMGTRTNHDLRIVSNDTERIRIMSTGIACFTCQICASSGVKFANGSSTLSYYEAGTWTPQLYWSGGGYYTMVGINGGSYVRVGNLVHLNFQLQWGARCSGGSFSGNLNIAGVPFTAGTYRSAGPVSAISSGVAASSCAYTWMAYTIDPGATFLYLIQQGQYGGYNHAPTTSDSGVIYSSTITYAV